MLQQRSLLFILDNSGAKKVRCIQVRNKPKRGVAQIADQITGSVQQLTTNNVKLKKGQLCQVLVLTTKKSENRLDVRNSTRFPHTVLSTHVTSIFISVFVAYW